MPSKQFKQVGITNFSLDGEFYRSGKIGAIGDKWKEQLASFLIENTNSIT